MDISFEIQIIAVLTAVSCSLLGTFLVLKNMSMISDAITHTVLLGIVIAFFVAGTLNSPLLFIGAGIMGIVTVYIVELLNNTRLLKEDAAIGVVFPLLFSISVILISRYAKNIHLDVDSVLLGELAFVPLNRTAVFGISVPSGGISVLAVLIINVLFVKIFFKELKLSTFDKALALTLGMKPVLIHYILMTLVSVTAVTSFEVAGSILVIAFMIGPPMISLLLSDRLSQILMLNIFISVIASVTGFYTATVFDVSIAGTIAVMIGVIFTVTLIFSPKKGLLSIFRRRLSQKLEFSITILLIHLINHESTAEQKDECGIGTIDYHLRWRKNFLRKILRTAMKRKFIYIDNSVYRISPKGKLYIENFFC